MWFLFLLCFLIFCVLVGNVIEERDAKRDEQHRELMERLGRVGRR